MTKPPKYPGIRVVANGNLLVSYLTEARLADAGIFYPITPSTEMGELFQQSFAEGKLNVFGRPKLAVEAEGEHAAQGGAIAHSVTGKRVVNFTSGQGLVYGIEQFYHAPGKLSTMVVEVASRALTKHALNVHCGHDDIYTALDTGWIMLMARDAQQAADQALVIRKVTELSLTPGINVMDGFLTSHLDRTFLMHESELIREFLGAPDDIIECPTPAQRELFGPTRRRVPKVIDLENPLLLGPVQNQEHYMNGVIARRNHFYEAIPGMLEDAWRELGELTGRIYGPLREYGCEGADTVFFSLGSAAENIEAACDYLAKTRGHKVGSIHLNVIRPFPEAAVVRALAGKKRVIILERNDAPLGTDNAIALDVRTALSKAVQHHRAGTEGHVPAISADEVPAIFTGSYGMGSRDFRPEGIIGAYEYVTGAIRRTDGQRAADGQAYFVLGIDHPYSVCSDDAPSLLPDGAIAVRLHSIGGWGMITTGKNLTAIIGELGDYLAEREGVDEVIHVSANPSYGSEKKGAPTAYFLVVAPERIRPNCDLRHVNVVLCCDPKAFTHSNPLEGMADGGAFVWESDEEPEAAWTRIPRKLREEILERGIRLFILPGFEIARNATDRPDLQLRMQGNAFLGAFFGVSSFLGDNSIDLSHFRKVVRAQYQKKFGRFGDAVVESNMTVMTQGFERVRAVPHGALDAPDRSAMRGEMLLPLAALTKKTGNRGTNGNGARERPNLFRVDYFDREFRAGLGYDQPASALASVGVVAAGTGATASKYVARRETPIFIAENCTQCMDCIVVCPDTALVSGAHELGTVLKTAIEGYVSDATQRSTLTEATEAIEAACRAKMLEAVATKEARPFAAIVVDVVDSLSDVSDEAKRELGAVLATIPIAYTKTKAIFSIMERKAAGDGGIFSIFISDLCKGCAACVTACGKHDALRMEPDSEALNAGVVGAMAFRDLLPDTPQKYQGLHDAENPMESKAGVLKNHLMERDNYDALVSGDGACAGCGEKSVLRAAATITEAHMRPIFHRKAARLDAKVERLRDEGVTRLGELARSAPDAHGWLCRAVAHVVMGLGGEDDADTTARLAEEDLSDAAIVGALAAVMRTDAFNHARAQPLEGRAANGMNVMAMAASTGCNTVYGSTPPNNPHPYPWMNSLFQDGATIGWLIGESFIEDHARRSVVPERLADAILDPDAPPLGEDDYFDLTHFSDALMTDLEVQELPRVWCVGGDGALGDIGYQNVSKVILQNRPNISVLMLDTQVYSNTGGQNSDSSPILGGGDMNQIGAATQGKLTEKKSVSETFTAGHGSPFVAQVSMADPSRLYRAMLEGLAYRGTSFFQCFTTCQPEHGVGDDVAQDQARAIRDTRGMPQFVFNPQKGETYQEAMDLAGNPMPDRDWQSRKLPDKRSYAYTVAHWAATEARFRRHLKTITEEAAKDKIPLEDMLGCLTQNDVVHRRHLRKGHRAYVPDFGVWMEVEVGGKVTFRALSRQLVLFCVERRKAWRLLQSKAGIRNKDYEAQRALLEKADAGEIPTADLLANMRALLKEHRP